MSDQIKNAIRARLQQAGLSEKHLDDPNAHVVASDGESLHVLVKDTQKLDTLEVNVRDAQGKALKQLEVKEGDEWDLGELGKWRDFAVSGVGELEKAAALE